MPDFNLTDAEVNAILTGLYERLDETKRYIHSTKQTIATHRQCGEKCCGVGSVAHARECLTAFEGRLAAISSAIDKLEGIA